MHFSTLIAVVAPAIITVSAKCYNNDGAGWGGSRQSANNAADAVCYNGDGGLAGNFAGTKSACRNIGDNLKALFFVTGNGYLSEQDCKFGLKEEINGCGWGGEAQHGAYYYRYASSLYRFQRGRSKDPVLTFGINRSDAEYGSC
ncbi:uncharacterized protein ALTATR162_LOCUS6975 [Alternaria atra]|uniref:Secreted protein n=1 Tax=Alternaria atra TaxID=119953 RepID=A0A8J2I4A2_9PLEO|nr:uncharacterized protein ALTATR162_LOCUS6975 [Alternaria atra]CAG5166775.1 unnamed protein product [Alternaria atra]